MYYLFGIIIIFLCLFALFHFWRKRKILCRLCCMSACDKFQLLDSLTAPLGYCYVPEWDVFSTRRDAWQKDFGYRKLFDKASPYFNMVYETLPVHFDYNGKTWLIQIWKGQYGICTGCEAGVYHADGIVDRKDWNNTTFHAADGCEMLDITTELWRDGRRVASLRDEHWWLTIFDVGTFSKPSQLCLNVSIQFPNMEMKNAFLEALWDTGVDCSEIFSYLTTVYFHFPDCTPKLSLWKRVQRWFVQCLNRMNCRLFCFVTRFCHNSCDSILYLYFYLPWICRHLLRLRHFPKRKR